MRRLIVSKAGGPQNLVVEVVPDLVPQDQEVRVQVKAAGLNFADVMARQGLYPDAPPFPMCLGYEFAGEIDAVGAGVPQEWLGRAVFGLSRFQGQAEQVCVPLAQVFEKPDILSFEQAAAIPVNYLTAWQLLVAMGGLQQGETLLIHNVGGGVGLAALEIARHFGARTIGTASARKHPALKVKGLDHAIDYQQGDWEPEVLKLTDQRGVELVIDPIGGSHLRKSARVLRSTGRLGMFGISSSTESSLFGKLKLAGMALGMPFFHPVGLMNRNIGVFGVNMGHLWHESEKVAAWMTKLLEGVHAGWINPHVDSVFRFDDAANAHRQLEERRNFGKVILVP